MEKGRGDALHRRVSARIRALSDARQITLSHLPDRAVVGRAHFWNVLSGKKSPTLQWLQRIAVALDVDVEDLVSRKPK